jgi:hypothetical protein
MFGPFSAKAREEKRLRVERKAAEKVRAAQEKVERARAIAIERTASWNRFWFRVKSTAAVVFFSFVALLAWGMWLNKDKPLVYSDRASPGSSALGTAAVTSPPKTPPAKAGDSEESKLEKVYEIVTGKEVVHKKDGTTYERSQPKKK